MTDFNVKNSNGNFEEFNNRDNAKKEQFVEDAHELLFEEEPAPEASSNKRKIIDMSRQELEEFFDYKQGEDQELFGMKVSDIIDKLLQKKDQPKPEPRPEPEPMPMYGFPEPDHPHHIVMKYGFPDEPIIADKYGFPDFPEGPQEPEGPQRPMGPQGPGGQGQEGPQRPMGPQGPGGGQGQMGPGQGMMQDIPQGHHMGMQGPQGGMQGGFGPQMGMQGSSQGMGMMQGGFGPQMGMQGGFGPQMMGGGMGMQGGFGGLSMMRGSFGPQMGMHSGFGPQMMGGFGPQMMGGSMGMQGGMQGGFGPQMGMQGGFGPQMGMQGGFGPQMMGGGMGMQGSFGPQMMGGFGPQMMGGGMGMQGGFSGLGMMQGSFGPQISMMQGGFGPQLMGEDMSMMQGVFSPQFGALYEKPTLREYKGEEGLLPPKIQPGDFQDEFEDIKLKPEIQYEDVTAKFFTLDGQVPEYGTFGIAKSQEFKLEDGILPLKRQPDDFQDEFEKIKIKPEIQYGDILDTYTIQDVFQKGSLLNIDDISTNIYKSKSAKELKSHTDNSMGSIMSQFVSNLQSAANSAERATSIDYARSNIKAVGNMALKQIDNLLSLSNLSDKEKTLLENQKSEFKNSIQNYIKKIEAELKKSKEE